MQPCDDRDACAQLNRDGFVVLRGFTTASWWDDAFRCPLVHHGRLWTHIQSSMMDLSGALGWDPIVSKYRASATCEAHSRTAVLHRDVSCVDLDDPPDLFSLHIYLDDATLRVVPASHRRLRIDPLSALALKSTHVEVHAGDAVLFWSTLLHATGATPRRVVKCLDIFPNKAAMDEWLPRMIHSWCPVREDLLASVLRLTGLSALDSRCRYLRSAAGLPRSTLPAPLCIVSGEARRPRVRTYDDFQEGNVYTPAPGARLHDAPPDLNRLLRRHLHGTYYSQCAILLVTVAVGIAFTRRKAGVRSVHTSS